MYVINRVKSESKIQSYNRVRKYRKLEQCYRRFSYGYNNSIAQEQTTVSIIISTYM